ncbi:unnamed protein product [Thelazia callipaeda]|uniref:DUF4604 domain-containing protein n=1 Tax=Thelazia callipaeda TaxID=103827 RepID=A0A0N5CUI0_THECL|nr:unnamed protein product [Thelazia callipaeda]
MDLKNILVRKPPTESTNLLDRLQNFLPKIAAANRELDKASKCDIVINVVGGTGESESDSSSSASTCSSSDSEDTWKYAGTGTEEPEVVVDVTTLKEDTMKSLVETSDSNTSDDCEDEMLPVGFRIKKSVPKKKRKQLIEEVNVDSDSFKK